MMNEPIKLTEEQFECIMEAVGLREAIFQANMEKVAIDDLLKQEKDASRVKQLKDQLKDLTGMIEQGVQKYETCKKILCGQPIVH